MDNKNPKLTANIISVIMAVLAIYLWFYGTTRLSAVAVGVALASIPLVRLAVTTMMATDKAIDIAKVSIKNMKFEWNHEKMCLMSIRIPISARRCKVAPKLGFVSVLGESRIAFCSAIRYVNTLQ